jgi:hypothetical protein
VASLQAYSSHGIQYYRIVESFRREGKPSIRVLAHLGRVDEILRRHQQLAEVPVKISSVSAGAVTALFGLAQELDIAGRIDRALSSGGEVQVRAGLTVGESLIAAMIARACAPRSKRAFADWAGSTYLPELMKFAAADLTSQHFWDQMNVMPLEKLPESYSYRLWRTTQPTSTLTLPARISGRNCRSGGITSRDGTISGRWVWLWLSTN